MTSILDRLEAVCAEIARLDTELAELDGRALALEADTADRLLAFARVGARFKPIVSKRKAHNCNACHHPDQHEHHDQRGLRLLEQDGDRRFRDDTSHGDHDVELWLTPDGLLLGDYSGCVSHWQNAWNTWERTLEPITTAEAVTLFGLIEIGEAVQKILAQRVKRMGSRAKSARRRLERAEQISAAAQ